MIIVGNRIRQARVLAGLTQEQLAEMIGVSRTTIARWEIAEAEPTLEHLLDLTRALHVSADYLLGIGGSNPVLEILQDMASTLNQIITELQEDKT